MRLKAELLEALGQGLKAASLVITSDAQEKLVDYVLLLQKWNSVHNLTAIRDPIEMVKKHVLDSLVLLPFLSFERMIDVGTGPGLPGIPLAICSPASNYVLLDSHQKKLNFVQHVVLSLRLKNVVVVCERVERYTPVAPFDCVISRAFASLADFIRLSGHLGTEEGRWIAMKGTIKPEELADLPSSHTIERVEKIFVPGVVGDRSLVFVVAAKKGVSSSVG